MPLHRFDDSSMVSGGRQAQLSIKGHQLKNIGVWPMPWYWPGARVAVDFEPTILERQRLARLLALFWGLHKQRVFVDQCLCTVDIFN